MSYNMKCLIIMPSLFAVSIIGMFGLDSYFSSKGLTELNVFCAFIPTTVMGIYMIFGKYVYLNGPIYSKRQRVFCGVVFLLLMPLIHLYNVLFKS